MKNAVCVLLLAFLSASGCHTKKATVTSAVEVEQEVRQEINFSEQSTWLLGYFSVDQLKREPHSTWFNKGFDEYQPDQDALNSLLAIPHEGHTIKIVTGTWCPDSRREVPRFMRILDLWKFPLTSLTFIGVDDAKISPVGEYSMLNIQRVPTFIIFINNIEAGRIIENPLTSLEQDMVNILSGID